MSGEGIERTESGTLRALFARILREYGDARRAGTFGGSHPVWQTFAALAEELSARSAMTAHPTMRVTWSVGAGNWAKVPWLSVLDERETSTTQRGVYPVFLFRQDLSGFYMLLGQGVTEPKKALGAAE